MIFSSDIYIARRQSLIQRMGCSGVVLLAGNELSPSSYPANSYYFRQDSTFRYFFGLDNTSLWATIDLDSGESTLYGTDISLDDIIWTGAQPSIAELGATVGVDKSQTIEQLHKYIQRSISSGRTIHTLPPYRGETKIALWEIIGDRTHPLSPALLFAVADLRECKGEEELSEIEAAYQIGYELHTTAMRMCRAGVIEREIGGRLEGIARSMGQGVSFPPICTQHGETIHNTNREGVLESGRLMLCDAGGERLSGYCSDHTRTYPINGVFSDIQRDIYNVALRAHNHVKAVVRPTMRYTDLQQETLRQIGDGFRELGFLRGSSDEILASGAATLFMPHGVSHSIGLDVHDCEALGERSFDVTKYTEYAERSTSCIIRSNWVLNVGTVISNEPGVYFIPELIERRRSEGFCSEIINYEKVERHLTFGGIRIEDELIITPGGCREVGAEALKRIPKTVDEIENFFAQTR